MLTDTCQINICYTRLHRHFLLDKGRQKRAVTEIDAANIGFRPPPNLQQKTTIINANSANKDVSMDLNNGEKTCKKTKQTTSLIFQG